MDLLQPFDLYSIFSDTFINFPLSPSFSLWLLSKEIACMFYEDETRDTEHAIAFQTLMRERREEFSRKHFN